MLKKIFMSERSQNVNIFKAKTSKFLTLFTVFFTYTGVADDHPGDPRVIQAQTEVVE
jgi:hypothetical protein